MQFDNQNIGPYVYMSLNNLLEIFAVFHYGLGWINIFQLLKVKIETQKKFDQSVPMFRV